MIMRMVTKGAAERKNCAKPKGFALTTSEAANQTKANTTSAKRL